MTATTKGRPARGRTTRQVGVTLPHELIPFFKSLGGSAWLRTKLEEEMDRWPQTLTLLLDSDVLGEMVAYRDPRLFTDDMAYSFGVKGARIDDHDMTTLTFDNEDGTDAIYHDGYDLWRVFRSDNGRYRVAQVEKE